MGFRETQCFQISTSTKTCHSLSPANPQLFCKLWGFHGFRWISTSKLNDWSSGQALFNSEMPLFPGPSKTRPFHQPGFVPAGWLTRPLKSWENDWELFLNLFCFVVFLLLDYTIAHGSTPIHETCERTIRAKLVLAIEGWNLISLDTMLNENIGNPKTPDTTKSTNPGALMV